jgi:hypothetical protein
VSKLGWSLFAAALVAAPQASAQVYKCVDASGKTVYLQSPCPPGAKSKVISRKAPESQDAPARKGAAKKGPPDPEAEFRKRQKQREEADKKASEEAADARRRQENCQRARDAAAQYEAGTRIARTDEKGERYFLDEAQIAQERARAQASVAEFCK